MAQATTTHTGTNGSFRGSGRRVARQHGKARLVPGPGSSMRGLGPGDVSGSPGTSRTSQTPPVSAQAYHCQAPVRRRSSRQARDLTVRAQSPGDPAAVLAICPLGDPATRAASRPRPPRWRMPAPARGSPPAQGEGDFDMPQLYRIQWRISNWNTRSRIRLVFTLVLRQLRAAGNRVAGT